ncbi:MAG TPA: hypothetical protein VFA32_09020 [Dehalococcoidia bacterium]|nr:hypothetical protein [Dehalococcoidia bacterium]
MVGALLLGGVVDLAGFGWSLSVDALLLTAAEVGVMFFVRETAGRRNRQARARD